MSKKKRAGSLEKSRKFKHNYEGLLSLIIPCYNESKRIPKLLKSLGRFIGQWERPLEIILIDDGSDDDTAKKIRLGLQKQFSNADSVRLIELDENIGKGGALKAGVAQATGDHLLTVDADMATDPRELIKWLRLLPNRTFRSDEILVASREHTDSKIKSKGFRRIAGLIFNFIIQLFTNLNIKDTQCGFKLYPGKIGKELFSKLRTNGWAHDVELLYQAKLMNVKIQQMPVSWVHQDDSKISLISDSIKMFGQTLAISSRLNWNFFIADPLKEVKSGNVLAQHTGIYRFLFVVLAVFLLLFMPMISFDFGITGDEELQKVYGEKVLAYFETNGEDNSALTYENLYYYGGMFDYFAALANKYIGGWDPYDMRHFLNAFVGFLMMLFAGLLGKELSGSWKVGFLSLLFIAVSPRIFGHSMNNPKDIPFAAAYVFTLVYLIRFLKELPSPNSKTIVLLIAGIAAAINVRVGGILLIAYFLLFTGSYLLLKPELRVNLTQFKKLGRIAFICAFIGVTGFFAGMIFWPYAQQAPLKNPFTALSEMSNFSTSIRMLFEGDHLWSDELPWYYIPKWILISAPIFTLSGLLAFLGFYALKFKKINALLIAFVAFTAIFPVAYAIYKQSSLYDGMRHFLFVYPILVILSAWGWNQLSKVIDSRYYQMAMGGILILLLALPLRWMVKNHPYEYTYFNEIFGGSSAAFAKYETDYWMTSMKGMSEWLAENDSSVKNGEQVVVLTNCFVPVRHYMRNLAPNVKVDYVRYNERHKKEGDYYFFFSRFVNKDLLKSGAWPPKEVIYEEKAGGITIGAITKRDANQYDFLAQQAIISGDNQQGLDNFSKELSVNPQNEVAALGLANAYLNLNDFVNAEKAIDQLFDLTGTYVNGWYAKGIMYYKQNNFPEARKAFEKVVELNYKQPLAYYYLAYITSQTGELQAAVDFIEKYDRENGNLADVYNLGTEVAKRLGDNLREAYFASKKAYLGGDTNEAYRLVQQALSIDRNYEPAVKFNERFQVN